MDKSKTLENELGVAYIADRTLVKEIKTSSVKTKAVFLGINLELINMISITQTTIIGFKTEKIIPKWRHDRRIFCFTLQNWL